MELARTPEAHLGLQPGRLWSLLEMINFQLVGVTSLLRQLWIEEQEMGSRVAVDELLGAPPPSQPGGLAAAFTPPPFKSPLYITNQDKQRIEVWLQFGAQAVAGIYLNAATHRIEIFTEKLKIAMRGADYVAEVRALREAIEGDIKLVYFYHYQPVQAAQLLSFEVDWAEVLKKFPSLRADAFAAVDCWCVGHYTASVFQAMRVAEIGLRALAKERKVTIRNKPLEWANWQDVLTQIGKKIELIGKRRAGPTKDKALGFYQGAMAEFGAIKDTYRNVVMHVRKDYDVHEAASALQHVREFMTRLSRKLGEGETAAIKWGHF